MIPTAAVTGAENPLVRRYEDAYGVASALVRRGRVLKVIGSVLAGISFVVATLALLALVGTASVANRARNPFEAGFDSGAGTALLSGGTVILALFGLGVGAALFEWGTGLSARGQLLQAQLDIAVYASPFLEEQDKRNILGIPARNNAVPMGYPSGQSLPSAELSRPDQSSESRTVTCAECAAVNPFANQYCDNCGRKLAT